VSKGYLISFEGLDGAGKTTQIDLLVHWLESRGVPYIRTREPGGTALGVEIRHLLFGRPELTITPLAEAFLFQADRAQHFATLILPALEAGTLVITDRCYDSSIAYQGAARGVGVELTERLSLLATQGHSPDLTILLDLDPGQVRARKSAVQERNGFGEEQSRFDLAAQSQEQIHQEIVALVERLLKSA
jgi:dTMP kinase